MKRLSESDFHEIRTWIYRNARPLELSMWQYYFEKGSQEAVLSSLAHYQNYDGGFGHALEADSWNPNSSPYTTLAAINILEGIGFFEENHPMIQGILNYLESGVYCSENGWYFNIPTNNDYAHAPWWTFSMEANITEGIGLTAEIAGYLLRHTDQDSGLYQKAIMLTDQLLEKLNQSKQFGDMGIGGYCRLLNNINQAGLTERFDCSSLTEKLIRLVHDSIVRDTSRWTNYSVRPSDYITSPESIFYHDNEDIVSTELDYLIATRPRAGVWGITWSWFENNEKYTKEFAISENWWKSVKAIEKMKFLRNFGRV